ncbi:MAG: DUF3592 domain-containing protein [Solirubrobacteraceae bacterium]|nr:DUF3592 domain-containing protein [Solirubrobacteraceae bacterium]
MATGDNAGDQPPRFVRPADVGRPERPPVPRPARSERPPGQGKRVAKLVAVWCVSMLVVANLLVTAGRQLGHIPVPVVILVLHLPALVTILVATRPFHREALAAWRRMRRSVIGEGVIVGFDEAGLAVDPVRYQRRPIVRFTSVDGTEVVSHAQATTLRGQVGDPIVVRFDPNDPSWVIPRVRLPLPIHALWSTADAIARTTMYTFAAVALMIVVTRALGDDPTLVVALAIVAFGLSRIWRQSQATVGKYEASYRRAQPAEASVAEVAWSRKGRTQQVTFAFRTHDGREVIARSQAAAGRRSPGGLLVQGQTVPVLYDPQQPDWVTVPAHAPELVRKYMRINLALMFGMPLAVLALLTFGLPALL